MAASRAAGPRRPGREKHEQGECPLYIPRGYTANRGQTTTWRSGPWPRKRLFRLTRFLAFTAFAAMGRSYRHLRFDRGR
jgi:hypothetical protein